MSQEIEYYWEKFQSSLTPDSSYKNIDYHAEQWGSGIEMANELGSLIANGTKTSTCSAKWEWEFEGEMWPKPGQLTIVLDGERRPVCIIETTEIRILPFNEVDAQFAFEEGEGDRTLENWRAGHQRFFIPAMQRIGREFDESIPLICERFRKIYPL